MNHLARILERKGREVSRRRRRGLSREASPPMSVSPTHRAAAIQALRRPPQKPPRVIAEVKFRSPSAGEIHPWRPGRALEVAASYARHGASAVSVLADRPGFGSGPLDVRRAADAVAVPVLFKEFVIDELQLDLARRIGASMVLLLVRALKPTRLETLVARTRALGMAPVVEAAGEGELEAALATGATIVGVNARDLRSFDVDPRLAARLVDQIPESRVAVYMSGIRSAEGLARVAAGRADAALIGEGLMRSPEPGLKLKEWLGSL